MVIAPGLAYLAFMDSCVDTMKLLFTLGAAVTIFTSARATSEERTLLCDGLADPCCLLELVTSAVVLRQADLTTLTTYTCQRSHLGSCGCDALIHPLSLSEVPTAV